ncbi:MAG: UDP-4-amino-4-deoxy-L-arabinose--oxoglutarate aminotransferase [Verrucomicrobiae bacterium]|nr:UDP-4-amino-4-deoxy-L-arabinose--oxoglutarate aminotransferase [Verrucomicrobiae bacterium]
MTTKLALKGGTPVIAPGKMKAWPPIDDIDRKLVMASLEQTSHAFGPNCVAFEKEFAAWNGNKYAITTNSGTAALHMAIVACGCGTGDEVIVSAYSWSSSATCILHHSCIPVFVDIDFNSINMDVNKLEAAITPKTKAIIVVHLHGLPVQMDKVMAIAKKHNIKVIEDACQAHGAKFNGKKVGTIGHCGAFSFNQNKCLCSGEGGMFVTDDEEMLNKARQLWSFGETATPTQKRDYHVYAMGWMYRNNDLTAAFGRAQLTKLDGYLALEIANAKVLTKALQGVPGIILPTAPEGCEPNHYNYTIRFDMEKLGHVKDASAFRYKIIDALKAEGVDTMVWQSFILPAMTVFQAKDGFGHGHPWSSPHAQPVDYSLDQYPMAQKHCDRHTGMTTPLRAPNGPDIAKLVAEAYQKVMTNLDQLS